MRSKSVRSIQTRAGRLDRSTPTALPSVMMSCGESFGMVPGFGPIRAIGQARQGRRDDPKRGVAMPWGGSGAAIGATLCEYAVKLSGRCWASQKTLRRKQRCNPSEFGNEIGIWIYLSGIFTNFKGTDRIAHLTNSTQSSERAAHPAYLNVHTRDLHQC